MHSNDGQQATRQLRLGLFNESSMMTHICRHTDGALKANGIILFLEYGNDNTLMPGL